MVLERFGLVRCLVRERFGTREIWFGERRMFGLVGGVFHIKKVWFGW